MEHLGAIASIKFKAKIMARAIKVIASAKSHNGTRLVLESELRDLL